MDDAMLAELANRIAEAGLAGASEASLAAAAGSARRGLAALNERRNAERLPVTDMYLGLGVGEVFYGNLGSKERLDFTVIGPAVNEVSRIVAMCRSVDQKLLVSSTFASSTRGARGRFVSVGRFALRGVGHPRSCSRSVPPRQRRRRDSATLLIRQPTGISLSRQPRSFSA